MLPRNAVQSSPRSLRPFKIGAVLTVVAMVIVAQQLGLFEEFAEPARARQTLVGLGGWGYVAFIAAYAVLQPFGVPGTVFIMAAPLVWPWPVAFVLSMTGTMCASVVGFSFARFVARDWVASKIPDGFKRYDDALERRALWTVFFLRLIFWMPPLLHAFFGVSKVKFSTHFWGSFAGYLLPLFLVSFAGEKLFELLRRAPLWAWVAVGVTVVSIWVTAYFLRRRSLRSARAAER